MSEALAAWLAGQRWFAGKTGRIQRVEVEDEIRLGAEALRITAVTFEDGRRDRYLVAGDVPRDAGAAGDALDEPGLALALLALVAEAAEVRGRRGRIVASRTAAFPAAPPPALVVRRIGGEQSNTSLAFGDRAIMKVLRRLAPGVNPEAELTGFLTEAGFPHAPALWGALDYVDDAAPAALAVVQALVPAATDGWQWVLAQLRADPTATLPALRRLGEVTGALHATLAAGRGPWLVPEPITDADLAAWAAAVEAQVERARAVADDGGPPAPDVRRALAGLAECVKIRHHGDFHLGQTLRRPDGDWVVIDFEGEPLRPLEERRRKHTPLRDVAGMLRSFGYAAATAPAPAAWEEQAREAFVAGYRARTAGAPFVPAGEAAFRRAVAAFETEKAAYEILYEASHRPDWLPIPRRGLLSAVARLRKAPAAGAA